MCSGKVGSGGGGGRGGGVMWRVLQGVLCACLLFTAVPPASSSPSSSSEVEVEVPLEGEPTLTPQYMLDNRDDLLSEDNCHSARVLHPHSSMSAGELSSYRLVLESMLASTRHAACASLYLCQLHLHSLKSHNVAYIYATRALAMFPRLSPALSCVSSLYFHQENYLRAGFYAELATRRATESAFIDSTAFVEIEDAILVRNQQLCSCINYVASSEDYLVLTDILEFLSRGNVSLYEAYSSNMYMLPTALKGPRITAYEAFLDLVEGAENACILTRENIAVVVPALHVYPEYRPTARWPSDKTIIIFNYAQIDTARKTFGENNLGLSDALNKLGVPHRILSRSIPEDDFITILNIGKVVFEEHGQYAFWNFEKNPSIQFNMTAGVDEKFDDCGNDVMRYSYEYISEAKGIWESVVLNLVKWPEYVSNNFLPALVPVQTILQSKVVNQFVAKACVISECDDLADLDAMRPIDILFFGASNPHRDYVHKLFRQLAEEKKLNVKFYFDYAFFGVERELAIQQSKIVLNLANFRWPYTVEDRQFRSTVSTDNAGAAESCAAATNHHRIRSLLSHGKVVLSESSGSTVEEAVMSDVVVFANTDQLAATALSLLSNRTRRFELEKEAIDYMLQDHNQCCIHHDSGDRPSSLTLLAHAVSDLADKTWPHWNSPASAAFDMTTFLQHNGIEDISTRQVILTEQLASNSLSEREVEIIRASAALGWTEIKCMFSNEELDPLGLHKPDLIGGLVGMMGNSTSPCHMRSNLPLLLGYLSRRYHYVGKILMIGFNPDDSYQMLHMIEKYHSTRVKMIQHLSPTMIIAAMHRFAVEEFDLIVLNQKKLQFCYEILYKVFLSSITLLKPPLGKVIVNHMWSPRYEPYSSDVASSHNSDAWKLLASVRQHENFDAALLKFDGGLLIGCLRRNPFFASPQFFLEGAESVLMQYIDRVIPVLSLNEVHIWLSNATGTNLYVRKFADEGT